jgi:putative DNA primase/helicase
MAADKPSASNQLSASDMPSNAPTLPAGFAYNAQNWLGKIALLKSTLGCK